MLSSRGLTVYRSFPEASTAVLSSRRNPLLTAYTMLKGTADFEVYSSPRTSISGAIPHDPLQRRIGTSFVPVPSKLGTSSSFWLVEVTSSHSLFITPTTLADFERATSPKEQRTRDPAAVDQSAFHLSSRTDLGPRADRSKHNIMLSKQLKST